MSKDRTKYKVVELFAGCGGLALGLENSGLNASMLIEIDKNAAATLRKNRPNWDVRCEDIANVDFRGVEADIVTAGIPCQSFSYAGKRLGFQDVRGTLFFEYARAVRQINPKMIVVENVKGLLRHDDGKTLSVMMGVFNDLGYHVEYKVLRSQYFDIAQKRERLFIIGSRKDLSLPIYFPLERKYTISLREALHDVPDSCGQIYSAEKFDVMKLVKEGEYWRGLPEDIQKKYIGKSYPLVGGSTGLARRLSWSEPSLTLLCSPSQKRTERCHPSETRPLKVREYARIQSFPDSWMFCGNMGSQYRQIGNAVPVNLAYHVGKCLITSLNAELDAEKMEILY